ncbi:MAG: hypothetical protein L0H35_05850, partial [Psychrobacter sp.]|nr:hypothetical protein [Psychrobacter sp.]
QRLQKNYTRSIVAFLKYFDYSLTGLHSKSLILRENIIIYKKAHLQRTRNGQACKPLLFSNTLNEH